MADIIYKYKDNVYVNITNKCNCRCKFCIRFLKDKIGDAQTLWYVQNPSKEEVLKALSDYDFSGCDEVVFCGYGEPTCALDILIPAARYLKEEKKLKVRLNTNGLGTVQNKRDIVPELSEVIDSISISLNAPSKEEYVEVVRPLLDDAFEQMIDFTVKCRDSISEVRWTVVDVLSDEELDRCKRLAKQKNINLVVRKMQ